MPCFVVCFNKYICVSCVTHHHKMSLDLSMVCNLHLQFQITLAHLAPATAHRAALTESLASDTFPNLLHAYPSQTKSTPCYHLEHILLYHPPRPNGSKLVSQMGPGLNPNFLFPLWSLYFEWEYSPQALECELLNPSWWYCLGRSSCVLRFQRLRPPPVCSLCFVLEVQDRSSQLPNYRACHLPSQFLP